MKIASYSSNSRTAETNLWLIDGNRHICITYKYNHGSGDIKYAATIFRPNLIGEWPNPQLFQDLEATTARRFEIRPVITTFAPFLEYNDMLRAIRYEMCHGEGCKGPRIKNDTLADDDSVSSGDSFLSLEPGEIAEEPSYEVDPRTFSLKSVHRNRYIITDKNDGETREIFICYKGSKSTGDLIYGASISHGHKSTYRKVTAQEAERHYATAMSRLNKCPVQMNIPRGFRHQLKRHAAHREDIVVTIVDKVFERQHGHLQIRGVRL